MQHSFRIDDHVPAGAGSLRRRNPVSGDVSVVGAVVHMPHPCPENRSRAIRSVAGSSQTQFDAKYAYRLRAFQPGRRRLSTEHFAISRLRLAFESVDNDDLPRA